MLAVGNHTKTTVYNKFPTKYPNRSPITYGTITIRKKAATAINTPIIRVTKIIKYCTP